MSCSKMEKQELKLRPVEELRKILKCPFCKGTPKYPSFLCTSGLLICQADVRYLDKCPQLNKEKESGVCGGDLLNINLPWLKYMSENAHYECPVPGCEVSLLGQDDLNNHLPKDHKLQRGPDGRLHKIRLINESETETKSKGDLPLGGSEATKETNLVSLKSLTLTEMTSITEDDTNGKLDNEENKAANKNEQLSKEEEVSDWNDDPSTQHISEAAGTADESKKTYLKKYPWGLYDISIVRRSRDNFLEEYEEDDNEENYPPEKPDKMSAEMGYGFGTSNPTRLAEIFRLDEKEVALYKRHRDSIDRCPELWVDRFQNNRHGISKKAILRELEYIKIRTNEGKEYRRYIDSPSGSPPIRKDKRFLD